MNTVGCYGFVFDRYKGERENRRIYQRVCCWWCWSRFFFICYTIEMSGLFGNSWKMLEDHWRSAVPMRDVDCKDVGVCSLPASWRSLDFRSGATPPSLLPPTLPPTSPLLLVCSSCSSAWLWVSIVASIASSGCIWARLDPNTCQIECQNMVEYLIIFVEIL